MNDFDPPFAEKPLPSRADIHKTDVLMRFSQTRGAEWFSVVAPPGANGMALVQNQQGDQFWSLPCTFAMRYSLKDSGRFNLVWRTSPIQAVAEYNSLLSAGRGPGPKPPND